MASKTSLRPLFFRASMILKGLDAILEIAGALFLWLVGPGRIIQLVQWLTRDEIANDPRDLVASHLRNSVAHFNFATEHFMAIYLFGHGIVKILLVIALLKRLIWAYPTAIVIFSGFVVYQIYRFTLTHSLALIALTVLDLLVIWFVWLEYRSIRSQHPSP